MYRRPTEVSKHVFKKDILYAYSRETNRGELGLRLNMKKSHTVQIHSQEGSIHHCRLFIGFLVIITEASWLFIDHKCAHVCLSSGKRALQSMSLVCVCVCVVFHMVASLLACCQAVRVKRPLPPTCNGSNTVLPVCVHN